MLGFLKGRFKIVGWDIRTACRRNQRRSLQRCRNVVRCFEDEERFSTFSQFHRIILFNPVDFEFHFLFKWTQERELAKTDMKRRASEGPLEESCQPSPSFLKGALDHHSPSSCSMTITSIAPLNVAGLIEFHVLETEPPILRTYCIVPEGLSTLGTVSVKSKQSQDPKRVWMATTKESISRRRGSCRSVESRNLEESPPPNGPCDTLRTRTRCVTTAQDVFRKARV